MRPRTRFLLFYAGAWTPFVALYALGVHQRAPLSDSIISAISSIGLAALLGLAVRGLIPLLRKRVRAWWTAAALHTLLGLAYSALWTAMIALMIQRNAPADIWRSFISNAIWFQIVTGLALYGLLAGAFTAIDASTRLREQEALAARAEALRVRAELRALRAQLNPHFLFNTLHSITALVRSSPSDAERALERFGMLMRTMLDIHREQQDEVPLADELRFVRTYLALEAMRLGDRLQVTEDIEPDALECYVLTFTLQPLVENAIRHGIAPLPRRATLRLSASLADDLLLLEIADDGAGADAGHVAARQGVGLQVVRQRLAARFGRQARLDITTAPNEGFIARLTMPVLLRPMSSRPSAEYAVPT